MGSNNDYSKGFALGAIIGGVAGAITALLLAPKSGAELRRDLSDKSGELYGKASDLYKNVENKLEDSVIITMNEGKMKAQAIIDTARKQAEGIMAGAEQVISEAKSKAVTAKETVADTFGTLKDATKAGADAFKAELKSGKDNPEYL